MIAGSWVRERRLRTPRLWPPRLRSWQTAALVLGVVLVAALGFTWYRGSSFVRIQRVTVTGLSGPDVPQIRRDLSNAARRMTTLNVNLARLESVVSPYGFVRRLTVTSRGAHGVVIHVAEDVPVAVLTSSAGSAVVDSAGRTVAMAAKHPPLPTVPVGTLPTGGALGGGAGAAVRVLGAAPYALLARIANATNSSRHGVIVQLRTGPQLYFGAPTQLSLKWRAAVAVLQNSGSAGASYIDVTDPERPAAGAGVSSAQASALGLATAPTAPSAGASTTTASAGSVTGTSGG